MKLYCFLIALLFFSSCSKIKDVEGMSSGDGNLTVRISLSDNDEIPISNNAIRNIEKTIAVNKPYELAFNDFNALIEPITELVPSNSTINASIIPSASNKRNVATSNVDANIRCRLKIRKKSTTTWVVNQVISNRQTPEIRINAGFEYEWFAYSFNETIDPIDVDASGKIPSSSIKDKDFIYAKGTINAEYGDNYLEVVLKRKTSMFAIDLDTQGLFGTIENGTHLEIGLVTGSDTSTFTNFLKFYDFDFINDTYLPSGEIAGTNKVNGNDMEAVIGFNNSIKKATFYTAGNSQNISANSIYVKLNPLSIRTANNIRTRTFPKVGALAFAYDNNGNLQTDPTPIFSISNSAFSVTRGKKYKSTIRAIEKGLIIDGVEWARSDLYYKDNTDNGSVPSPYRFLTRFTQEYNSTSTINLNTNKNRYYWSFLSTTPTGAASNSIVNDPCGKVMPEGSWRIPTVADATKLINYTQLNSTTPSAGQTGITSLLYRSASNIVNYKFRFSTGLSSTLNYVQVYPNNFWAYTSDYDNQSLIFTYAGYVSSANSNVDQNSNAQIWVLGGANAPNVLYKTGITARGTADANPVLPTTVLALPNSELFVVNNYDANFNTQRRLIRCVRNR